MYLLQRTLSDCDDQELVELADHLGILTQGRYQHASVALGDEHQARLAAVLTEIDRRLHRLFVLDQVEGLSRAGTRSP